MQIDHEYVIQRSQLEDANFALHCAYAEIDILNESICTLIDLVEKAYFAGWRAGYITDISDSSEFNSCEDWLESDIREELKKYHRTGKPEDNE